MSNLTPAQDSAVSAGLRLPAMSAEAVERVRALQDAAMDCEQVETPIEHLFHAGMYVRTLRLPAGVVLTGAMLKVPTVVIVNGHCTVFTGETTVELRGFNVLPGSAGRKQAFTTHGPVEISAFYPTSAKSVAEVERESTDEHDLLLSNRQNNSTIQITGE